MNDRIWHKGSPPHIGWWNASLCCDIDAWRWWNDECWSMMASSNSDMMTVRSRASRPAIVGQDVIEWNDYWPENARVERMKP